MDQSWSNSSLLDIALPVLDYEECQLLCRVRVTFLNMREEGRMLTV